MQNNTQLTLLGVQLHESIASTRQLHISLLPNSQTRRYTAKLVYCVCPKLLHDLCTARNYRTHFTVPLPEHRNFSEQTDFTELHSCCSFLRLSYKTENTYEDGRHSKMADRLSISLPCCKNNICKPPAKIAFQYNLCLAVIFEIFLSSESGCYTVVTNVLQQLATSSFRKLSCIS
jgi:hypothetical protein